MGPWRCQVFNSCQLLYQVPIFVPLVAPEPQAETCNCHTDFLIKAIAGDSHLFILHLSLVQQHPQQLLQTPDLQISYARKTFFVVGKGMKV